MKIKRHSKIVELIRDNNIETQEDLLKKLKETGFKVTQATISRDIRELKLTKMSIDNGRQKYTILTSDNISVSEKFTRVFKETVISIDYAQNMIIIKTLNGMAMGVGAALDSMSNIEIMGTIAGDDTIFCVVKNEQKAIKIIERLRALMKFNREED